MSWLKDQGIKRTQGPEDQRTRDKGAKGPGDQRTKGPEDHKTRVPTQEHSIFPRILDFFPGNLEFFPVSSRLQCPKKLLQMPSNASVLRRDPAQVPWHLDACHCLYTASTNCDTSRRAANAANAARSKGMLTVQCTRYCQGHP